MPFPTNQYLQQLPEHYPHGIVFHYFHGGKYQPAQGAISAEEFEQTLLYIGTENILPAADWLEKAEKGTLQETDICITFDEGLREQYDLARPVMEKHGVTAFFFVYSSPMEGIPGQIELYRYIRNACFPSMMDFYDAFDAVVAQSTYADECTNALSTFDHTQYMKNYSFHPPEDKKFRFLRDDVLGSAHYDEMMNIMIDHLEGQGTLDTKQALRDLWMGNNELRDLASKGHVLGLHSYSHPTTMGRMPVEEQREEYGKNHAHLLGLMPSPPKSMAHPCNSFNEATVTVMNELGVTVGFRSDMGQSDGPFSWPRNDNTYLLQDLKKLSEAMILQ